MSRTFEVKIWDDLSEPRTVEADRTLLIGMDGEWRELDLTDSNYQKVRSSIAAYFSLAHTVDRELRAPGTESARQQSIEWWAGLRKWAGANGYNVGPSPNYYVPMEARKLYAAEHGPAPVWRRAS